jgi:hypothetical protein
MIELRWVTGGPNRILEYRTRPIIIDAWNDVRGIKGWSDWKVVPQIDVNESAYEDLIASGGLPAVGG